MRSRQRRNGMTRYVELLLISSSISDTSWIFPQIKSIQNGQGESKSEDIPRIYALHRYEGLNTKPSPSTPGIANIRLGTSTRCESIASATPKRPRERSNESLIRHSSHRPPKAILARNFRR
jgi:hypothetical protein